METRGGMSISVRRPWWRTKRSWAAALTIWLLVGYPLSSGPVVYLVGRGWLSPDAFNIAYLPVANVVDLVGPRSPMGPLGAGVVLFGRRRRFARPLKRSE